VAIPLRADLAPRAWPSVSFALVCANGVVFLYTLSLGSEAGPFLDRFGLVPREWLAGRGGGLGSFGSPLFAMFLHGGWLHLVGNLFYLWIFGPPIERRLGWRRFLGFYFACGLTAAAIHVASDPSAFVPTVGASGAVAGLLSAYAVSYPAGRLQLFWPAIRVPATALLLVWVAAQAISGLPGLGEGAGGVASWAHLGGFLAGVIGIRWLDSGSSKASASGS
jgi:membrane associated rhomboid family serine protease